MDKITIDTYNHSPQFFADKFHVMYDIRAENIRKTLKLSPKANPKVVELGCADGQGAEIICQQTDKYLGIDMSKGLLQIAEDKQIPQASFKLADICKYEFGSDVDVVFAFGCLLHSNKEEVVKILKKVYESLSVGGLLYMSIKEGEYTGAETKIDVCGRRNFYYYTQSDVKNMAHYYEMVSLETMKIGKTTWLNVLLRKK